MTQTHRGACFQSFPSLASASRTPSSKASTASVFQSLVRSHRGCILMRCRGRRVKNFVTKARQQLHSFRNPTHGVAGISFQSLTIQWNTHDFPQDPADFSELISPFFVKTEEKLCTSALSNFEILFNKFYQWLLQRASASQRDNCDKDFVVSSMASLIWP